MKELQSIFHETLLDSKADYKAARARQVAYTLRKTAIPSYHVSDKILFRKILFQDYYNRTRPSSRPAVKKYGPFKILELVSKKALKLSIPTQYRIYSVVHVIHTEPYHWQLSDISHIVYRFTHSIPPLTSSNQVKKKRSRRFWLKNDADVAFATFSNGKTFLWTWYFLGTAPPSPGR